MFSAIKKAFAKEEDHAVGNEAGKKGESPRVAGMGSGSPGIHQMDASLQRRFAKGIQYNSESFWRRNCRVSRILSSFVMEVLLGICLVTILVLYSSEWFEGRILIAPSEAAVSLFA